MLCIIEALFGFGILSANEPREGNCLCMYQTLRLNPFQRLQGVDVPVVHLKFVCLDCCVLQWSGA